MDGFLSPHTPICQLPLQAVDDGSPLVRFGPSHVPEHDKSCLP